LKVEATAHATALVRVAETTAAVARVVVARWRGWW
jgi:hypothetical protein